MAKTEAIRDQAIPLDPTVRALGVVSLLNDFSSEVAVRTLPLFLANVLGVKIGIIGLIEGIAESTATLLKLLSGYLSDRSGRKKALALWGYGFSNLTKPLLYFATSWGLVLAVRFLDRVGKGIRTAPRDALIADITPPELRGRAFGFNKAMDKAGGFLGLIVAAGVLHLTQQDTITLTRESYEWLVLLAVLPGFAAVGVMAWWVEERPKAPVKSSPVFIWSEMNGRFWAFIAVLTLFMLGNSSDAFLMLRAQTVGFSTVEIFLVVAAFSLVVALTSTKGGNALRYFRQARVNNRGLADLRPHLFRLCLCVGPLAHMDSLCWVRPLLWGFFGSVQRVGSRLSLGAPSWYGLWYFQRGLGRSGVSGEPSRRTALELVRPLGTIPLRSGARSSGDNRFAHDSTTAVMRCARHRRVQIVQVVQSLRSVGD